MHVRQGIQTTFVFDFSDNISQMVGYFLKSLVPFFRRTDTPPVDFKMKNLRKSTFQC